MDTMKDNIDIFMSWEEAAKYPCYNPDIPPLSGHILALFDPDTPRRTVKDFVYHTGKHPNTIKKHIRELIKAGLMRKHGKGKATWYTL